MCKSEVYHLVLHTTLVRFELMNQGMFQLYLIPAGNIALHAKKMIVPRVLGYTSIIEITAAAALFDLSVYYFTHPSTSFKWEAVHPLHEEKESLVNLLL